jgi:hypothetical protein
MSDFVRDLEGELIAAAHRRARRARKLHLRPPALLTAALVAAAVMLTALLPRPSGEDLSGAVATVGSCSFPDATLLLRDEPCTSNPFGQ